MESSFYSLEDVLRVGGLLNNAPLSEEYCHAIILPKCRHVSKLIARHIHEPVTRNLRKEHKLLNSFLRQTAGERSAWKLHHLQETQR